MSQPILDDSPCPTMAMNKSDLTAQHKRPEDIPFKQIYSKQQILELC